MICGPDRGPSSARTTEGTDYGVLGQVRVASGCPLDEGDRLSDAAGAIQWISGRSISAVCASRERVGR
jgi:hypothetical protein